MALLVGENIHYQPLKLVYSHKYAKCNVPIFLSRILVLYGVWHLYNYTSIVH